MLTLSLTLLAVIYSNKLFRAETPKGCKHGKAVSQYNVPQEFPNTPGGSEVQVDWGFHNETVQLDCSRRPC